MNNLDFAVLVHDTLYNNHTVDAITGCWIYTGEIDKAIGYGRVMIDGIRYHTHRLSAFYHLGLDLSNNKEFACHTCSNRACWNPTHLYIGNNRSNQLDVLAGKCKKGHDLIGDNIQINWSDGKPKRLCRICHRERGQRNRKLRKDAHLKIVSDRKEG